MGKRNNSVNRPMLLSVVLVLFAMTFAVNQYKVPTIMPQLIAQFDMSAGLGSWLITAFVLASVVVALPAGPMAERFGVKRTLLVSACITMAGTLVGLLFAQPIVLVVSRAFEGIGFAFVCVGGPLLIEKLVPVDRQATAKGIWSVWIPLGCCIGEMSTPAIYELFGFSGVWGGCLALIFVFTIIFIFAIRIPKEEGATPSVKVQEEALCDAAKPRLLTVNFILFLIAFLSFNVLNFCLVCYAPSYMQGIGIDPSMSGLIATIPMLLSLVTQPLGGALIDRIGHAKGVLVIALTVNMVTTVAMFLVSGAALWVSAITLGLVGTLTFVASLVSLDHVISDMRVFPLAVSAYMFVECSGELVAGLITPWLLGPALNNWTQLAIGLAVFGAVGIVCAVACRFKKFA